MKDIEEDNLKDIAEIQIRIRLTVGAVFESLKVEYNDISPHMLILIYSGILSETLGRFSVYFTAEEQETLKRNNKEDLTSSVVEVRSDNAD